MKDEDLNEFGELAEFASLVKKGVTKWFSTATPDQIRNLILNKDDKPAVIKYFVATGTIGQGYRLVLVSKSYNKCKKRALRLVKEELVLGYTETVSGLMWEHEGDYIAIGKLVNGEPMR